MDRIIKMENKGDIPLPYQATPIADLIEYHNFKKTFENYTKAEILIGMCMDNRKQIHIPVNFAYILRSGGGSLRYSEFKVSYVVSIGGVRAIALLAHDQCGMVGLHFKQEKFINGLVENGGWDRQLAEEHFSKFAPMFEIGNEIDFVLSEAKRLRQQYPKITVAPLLYKLEDNYLYAIKEDNLLSDTIPVEG